MPARDPLWRRYLRFTRPDPRADVGDELRFHWEELVRRYRAEGMDQGAAERAARAQFGDFQRVQQALSDRSVQQHRRAERAGWWMSLRYDLRVGARKLIHQPAFSIAAIATLGLGIGANVAVFSVVNSALIRPLPYPQADRLVRLYEMYKGRPFTVSPPNFSDWRAQAHSFTGVAAFNNFARTLTGYGDPQPVPSASVTEDFFRVMGVQPRQGRPFSAGELTYGQTNAVIVSDGLWRTTFGAREDLIGRTLQLDGRTFDVVGIMPPGFDYPSGTKIWTPWAFSADELATQRGAHWLSVVARLKPGVTLDAATRDVAAISARLAEAYPNTNKDDGATSRTLRDAMVGATPHRALLVLLGAVALVVLIACSNVANLLLARGAARQRELATRAALGARPRDLIGMALTESVLLGVIGGVVGLTVAWWATKGLDALRPDALKQLGAARVDLTVLAFTLGLSVATGLLFGMAPALQAARVANVHGTLQAGGRGGTIGRGGWRVRGGLVTVELALAVMLLVGAGLLIRSFSRLESVAPGFDGRGVLTFYLSLPDQRYPKAGQSEQFYRQMLERIRGLPGVASAASISGLPLDDYNYSISTHSLDGVTIESSEQPSTQIRIVTPDLFQTLHIRLLRGRTFVDTDREGAPNVVVMNGAAAKLLFNTTDPIGHSLEIGTGFDLGRGRAGGQVVGIVDDVHDDALGTDPRPTIYFAHAQFPLTDMANVVRAADRVDPVSLATPARAQLRMLDDGLPMLGVRTMDRVAQLSVAQPQFAMTLLAAFAAVALVLAAVGVFGVMSYVVGQRAREIGVRMALGADGHRVVGETLRRALVPVVLGVVMGSAGALLLTGTMTNLLYEVTPGDPVTVVAVAVGMALIAVVAAWLPARRASRVDPVLALRSE
jgi:putative ABC transport system permease protein